MSSLHAIFDNPIARKDLEKIPLPDCISSNLKPGYGQRLYQVEAFRRFIYFWNEDFDGKIQKPYHLLYNMATGSGKTLVMAGLILYLYEKGYRNFLFFVSSTNIIDKTRSNFLDAGAFKYLFNAKIIIDGKEVLIKEAQTFESADTDNINIKFTTTQLLHSELLHTKENGLTFEDFRNRRTVLLADEAHHLNSGTKKGDLFGSWEGTILEIFKQSRDNVLLEFTATHDHQRKEIAEKYESKIIYKYDLAQFRIDKYSKEISLIRSLYDEKERMLQALILNTYRQELANLHGINLKPVILFKAKSKIEESERHKKNFHRLIEEMSPELLEKIRNTSTVPIVQKAFSFFDARDISLPLLAERIQWNFREENCISANNDKEAELNQMRLNTLESDNNPIRAVFAVHKLNEGWDVLNLFDIVRLYEGQSTGGSSKTIGATTLSEAQLIGRGARYFPFALEGSQDKFRRKYDEDLLNDLRILEELYYHTKEDSRYISELKRALVRSGIYEDEDDTIILHLQVKPEIRNSEQFRKGMVALNYKIPRNYKKVNSFKDLGILNRNFEHRPFSGTGKVTAAFNNEAEISIVNQEKDIRVSEIPLHIIRSALAKNCFFNFDRLSKLFPNISSTTDFITDPAYLGGIRVTFIDSREHLGELNNEDYMHCMQELLKFVEHELKSNNSEFEGSELVIAPMETIFKNKTIKVHRDSERANGQEELVRQAVWYGQNANYGTSEEKALLRLLGRMMAELKKNFSDILVLRNERTLPLFDKFGRRFEPDFILFCTGKERSYQVFLEAKGNHLLLHDKWKEDFLKELLEERRTIFIGSDPLIVIGLDFYNQENERSLQRAMEEHLL